MSSSTLMSVVKMELGRFMLLKGGISPNNGPNLKFKISM